jgi:chaperone modulatory protein CbpM
MSFTEQEVVEIVGLPAKRLRAWVRRGWVRPEAKEGAPVFDEVDVARAALLRQLCEDLEIEESSVGVVLSLLDQVHTLRAELRSLAYALEHQPEPVRREIIRLVRGD